MSKRLKKRAFELSINFLVVMIISIVIFSLGIVFVKKIFTHADKTQAEYFEKYEREVQNLLCDADDLVCIPKDTIDFGIDNEPVYGVVINNYLGTVKNFELVVSFNAYFDESNTKICDSDSTSTPPVCSENPQGWEKHAVGTFDIANNAKAAKFVALSPKGAKSGNYVFDVKVCVTETPASGNNVFTDGECASGKARYSSIQKIYLYIP